jgi:hypothetical protein
MSRELEKASKSGLQFPLSKPLDADRGNPRLATVPQKKARAEEVRTPRPELPPTELTREQSRDSACP